MIEHLFWLHTCCTKDDDDFFKLDRNYIEHFEAWFEGLQLTDFNTDEEIYNLHAKKISLISRLKIFCWKNLQKSKGCLNPPITCLCHPPSCIDLIMPCDLGSTKTLPAIHFDAWQWLFNYFMLEESGTGSGSR